MAGVILVYVFAYFCNPLIIVEGTARMKIKKLGD